MKLIRNRCGIMILAIAAFVSGCSTKQKATEQTVPSDAKTQEAPEVKNERPVMTFSLTDGSSVDAQTIEEKMVLILFQPDCDHCQAEARQIKARLEAFRDYQLFFISSQPLEVIQEFAREYGLAGKPNVHFGWTSVENVLNNYGAISAPSLYIYNDDGKLVESFEGQVDVEVVIKYL